MIGGQLTLEGIEYNFIYEGAMVQAPRRGNILLECPPYIGRTQQELPPRIGAGKQALEC